MPTSAHESRLHHERRIYRTCLRLAQSADPSPLLTRALDLLVDLTGATCGYIELQDTTSSRDRRWSASSGLDVEEQAAIRRNISRGIIAATVESKRTLNIPSALLDARFQHRDSVQISKIEAVLCTPIRSADIAGVGVIYIQSQTEQGIFDEEDVFCVELVAQIVGVLGSQILRLDLLAKQTDKTKDVRARLRINGSLVGKSHALAKVLERLEVIAKMETNVLLTGDSGSGKSLLAEVLHKNSARAGGPFVSLNCAAIPEMLLESELFGANKGAHSAVADKGMVGKVEVAEGGVLFLDEVGELPLGVQAKLLHLVQDKSYFRLGSTTPIRSNVRILTATNRDLEKAVLDRTFREDLFYRIRGVQLRVPALEERREDIPLLVTKFCSDHFREEGVEPMPVSSGALVASEYADWPGNVRQLQNACMEAIVNARLERASTISTRHFFPDTKGGENDEISFSAARAEWERSFIERSLRENDWNVTQTMSNLKIKKSTWYALIQRLGLRREE